MTLKAVRSSANYLPLSAADWAFQSSSFTTKVPTHNLSDICTNSYLEKYHSTPETQTDDSYNHPEDIEHFSHHERIDRQETERESKFTGVSVEELEAAQAKVEAEAEAEAEAVKRINEAPQPVGSNQQDGALPNRPPVIRVPPPEKLDPAVRFAGEKPHNEEWGAGERGYKTPRDASDRMRRNVPYKVRFSFSVGGIMN